MKKLLFAVLVTVAAGSSAFAADANKLSYRVKSSFEAQFLGAENVSWTTRETFTKANFTLEGQNVEAFFSTEGDLLGTSRKVEYGKLPVVALKKIEKKYPNAKVVDAIEFEQENGRSYFVSLEEAGKKQILEVSLYGAVSLFQGNK